MQIQKLKTELERLFKLVIKTPEIQIDYDYFALISDYVDWIENNKFLKKTLYSTKSFEKYQPEALLIIKVAGTPNTRHIV